MKKLFVLMTAAVILAAASASAQDAPRRHHTRPPYSGPKLNSKKGHPPILGHARPGAKAGFSQKGKADHILVR